MEHGANSFQVEALQQWRALSNRFFCIGPIRLLRSLFVIIFLAVPTFAATIAVRQNGDVQGAINSAQCGDTITLEAGVTFPVLGSFRLPNKPPCTQPIVITTSNPDGTPSVLHTAYPNSYSGGTFTRITPALAANMPKLVGTSPLGTPVLMFLEGSHDWTIRGLEITTDGKVLTTALVTGNDAAAHHLTFEQNFVHPKEEVGDLVTNIAVRSTESAFIISGHHLIWRQNAIQGFTGSAPPVNGSYRLNANSILVGYLADSLIENNLLEANGQLFFSGGGGVNPAHQARATNVTSTSATLSNTTDLDVGDIFAIYSQAIGDNHRLPHTGSPNVIVDSVGHYVTGRVLKVNHTTGLVTYANLNASINYRSVDLNLWGATSGTYTLTFMGQTTAPLAWNASYHDIRTALENLSNLVPGEVLVNQGIYAPINIRIGYNSSGQPTGQWAYPTKLSYSTEFGAPITVNYSNLSGGIRTASATIKSSESFNPVEGSVANPLMDAPLNGADVRWEGFQTHNVMVRRNIIAHHPEWTRVTGSVKGFAEVKGGDHITFDGNIFSGEGTTIIWTVRNQGDGGSSPWSDVSYSKVTNNIFDVTGYTNAFALADGAQQNTVSHDIDVSNNLFVNPDMVKADGPWIKLQSGYNVRISHNTVFADQDLIYGVSYVPSRGAVIKDNIFRVARYPAPCTDGPGPCWPGSTASNNLILNNLGLNRAWMDDFARAFPGPVWIEDSLTAVGFENPNVNLDITGDYRLKADSPYHAGNARQASDGKDLGVDFNQLYYAVYGIGTPPPPAGTTPTITPLPAPSPVTRPRRYRPLP